MAIESGTTASADEPCTLGKGEKEAQIIAFASASHATAPASRPMQYVGTLLRLFPVARSGRLQV